VSGIWTFPPEEGDDSPWPIFRRVLEYSELDLQAGLFDLGVTWAFVMREDPNDWLRGGKRILGTAQMPAVTGALSGLFDQLLEDTLGYLPDFLIVLNSTYWADASDREREILIFHEAKHCGQAFDAFGMPKFSKQTGRPILGMVAHDVEEFSDVVARYGAWKSDLRDFFDAYEHGPKRPNGERAGMASMLREALRDVDLEVVTAEAVRAVVDGIAADILETGGPLTGKGLRELTVTLDALPDEELYRDGTPHRESEGDVF
jgi:hypothetical protein